MTIDVKVRNDIIDLNNAPKAKTEKFVINGEKLYKLIDVAKIFDTYKKKGKDVEPILKTIP